LSGSVWGAQLFCLSIVESHWCLTRIRELSAVFECRCRHGKLH